MKSFNEFLVDENFNKWLLFEKNSSRKESRELSKMMEDAGFTYIGGTKEDKWIKDGVPVTVSRNSNIPAAKIFKSAVKDWEKNRDRINSFKQRQAV